MKDWVECESCGTEFRVVSDTKVDDPVAFCPYCGEELDIADEDEEFEEDEDYDFED